MRRLSLFIFITILLIPFIPKAIYSAEYTIFMRNGSNFKAISYEIEGDNIVIFLEAPKDAVITFSKADVDKITKNNERTTNNITRTHADEGTSSLHAAKFNIIDKRNPAEREGRPYPNSWFSYIMHGDQSLNVDRMAILKIKLLERFGSKLEGKNILLTQFYVMEATVRPSFYKTPSGKQIPNTGPAVPTLISEITMSFDGNYFHGSDMLPLPKGSRSTESTLTTATMKVVDDVLKDIARQFD